MNFREFNECMQRHGWHYSLLVITQLEFARWYAVQAHKSDSELLKAKYVRLSEQNQQDALETAEYEATHTDTYPPDKLEYLTREQERTIRNTVAQWNDWLEALNVEPVRI